LPTKHLATVGGHRDLPTGGHGRLPDGGHASDKPSVAEMATSARDGTSMMVRTAPARVVSGAEIGHRVVND
jgi:hypothetical protein